MLVSTILCTHVTKCHREQSVQLRSANFGPHLHVDEGSSPVIFQANRHCFLPKFSRSKNRIEYYSRGGGKHYFVKKWKSHRIYSFSIGIFTSDLGPDTNVHDLGFKVKTFWISMFSLYRTWPLKRYVTTKFDLFVFNYYYFLISNIF